MDAVAGDLPFDDNTFAGALATFTVHQWPELELGLAQMRRVSTGPVVILTCDPEALDRFWLAAYAPEVIETEAHRYPRIQRIVEGLGGDVDVIELPIPNDCVDGFGEAYYGRPEMLLDEGVRLANSAWSFVDDDAVQRFTTALGADLDSGRWDTKWGHLRTEPEFMGSLRLVVGHPTASR